MDRNLKIRTESVEILYAFLSCKLNEIGIFREYMGLKSHFNHEYLMKYWTIDSYHKYR